MILDTNAVSALLMGEKALGRKLGTSDHHHLPLMVIAEYQYGLLASRKRAKLQSLLTRLESESVVLCPDRETADWYASIRNELRVQGCPIPENDIWIAALARQYALDIVSQDAHFDDVRKVRRISW